MNPFDELLLSGVLSQPTKLPPAPVFDTRTFQEYDKSNAPARAQIISQLKAMFPALDPQNPYPFNVAEDVLGRFKGLPPAPKAQQEQGLRDTMRSMPVVGMAPLPGTTYADLGKMGAAQKLETLADLQRVMGLSQPEAAALLNKQYQMLPPAPRSGGSYGLQR